MVHWDIHPQAADLDPVARIRADSAALADAAAGRLDASVEHFSTNVADAPPLGTALSLDATDADASWTVQDGPSGTLRWHRGGSAPTTLRGTASDLLLWLYGRAGVTPSGDAAVVDRFRAHVDTS